MKICLAESLFPFPSIPAFIAPPFISSSLSSSLLVFIGYPAMPIYWALGYHLCRWGYGSSSSTWEVVKSMRSYGIPQVKLSQLTVFVFVSVACWTREIIISVFICSQESQWNDIDYMDRYLDFTLDANFATLPDVVKDLHAHNQRYVLIVVHGSLYLLSFVPCV